MATRGLFVGRFQPLHLGHLHALAALSREVDRLLIVIGSSQYSHTLENPFTAGERVWMLEEGLAEQGLAATLIPIQDIHRNSLWVSHVETHVPPFDVCYTNNPLPARLFREAGYDVRAFPLHERERYEARSIRELMLASGPWQTLVPKAVVRVVDEVDGIARMKDLARADATDEHLSRDPPYKKR